MTIPDLFQASLEKHKDNIAFNYFDREWKTITYQDLGRSVRNISAYLDQEVRIKKGERVAIILENRPEWGIIYFGVVASGAIAVPIDVRSTQEEIENLINDSEASFLFFSERTSVSVPGGKRGISVDSDLFKQICGIEQSYQSHPGRVEDSDLASIIYTSGTTGRPKGVMLSHRNFCSDAMAALKAGIVNERDNVLSILPLHHTYPFMCTLLVPIIIGASITYPPSLKGPEMLSTIKEKKATVLVGVPQVLEMIRDGILRRFEKLPAPAHKSLRILLRLSRYLRRRFDINAGRIIFRSIHKKLGPQFRFFTSGGARLDPSVFNDLEALGFTVLEGYGLSETSPIVTFNPIEKRKPGSAGKPLPNVEIKIINPSESGEGEIAIKGPMVMEGYFKNPEETARTIMDGWLRTGDLGYIDRDGYLFITGRVKEVIVLSSGKNVYPEDVEREYLRIPLIKEICVFGLEEKGLIESLHGIIVPDFEYMKKARIANLQEALKWEINQVSMKLPPHMRIKGFTVHTEPLPRTALGKLRRYLIYDIYRSKKVPRVRGEDPRIKADELSNKVAECVRSLIREDIPIQLEDNLELDLGFDSLRRIELEGLLEEAFDLKLPEGFTSEIVSIGNLIIRLREEIKKGERVGPVEPEKELKSIGFYQGYFEKSIVFLLLCLIRTLLRVFFGLHVKGVKNIPEHPFIIAPNHSSYLDGFVIASSVPYHIFSRLFFQGFQRYFRGRLTSLFGRLAHVIPIDPETFLSRALETSSTLIRKGCSLCIFPEGGRSFDGNIMEFKKGIGVLSIKSNIPVVPTRIEGTFHVLPRGARIPRFGRIRVTFGKPLYPGEIDFLTRPVTSDEYQFFADRLREEVIRLGAEESENK
ncbi:MAG: AMP-binding protein [Thermodesulfovibrionales bacterium]